jgi:hypothetical protein
VLFLAGTPTNFGPETYSTFLYKVGETSQLQILRSISSSSDGLYAVNVAADGSLVVAYPHIKPRSIEIIHANEPGTSDIISVQHEEDPILGDGVTLVRDQESQREYEIWPFSRDADVNAKLLGIAIDQTASPRTRPEDIQTYSHLETYGVPGGASFTSTLTANIHGNKLQKTYGKDVGLIATLPIDLGKGLDGKNAAIVGANDTFLIFCIAEDMDQVEGETSRTLYIENRREQKWTTLSQPGSLSRTRLFGNWLVTIVQDGKKGSENDEALVRSGEDRATRKEYESYQGAISFIPGEIIMDNLATGDVLRLITGQEDSEVIGIYDDNKVFYRVNDHIYRAEAQKGKLMNPEQIAVGPEVRTVHWMIREGPSRIVPGTIK